MPSVLLGLIEVRDTHAQRERGETGKYAPWLSWLQRPTVMLRHRKVVSSSLTGAVIFATVSLVVIERRFFFIRSTSSHN